MQKIFYTLEHFQSQQVRTPEDLHDGLHVRFFFKPAETDSKLRVEVVEIKPPITVGIVDSLRYLTAFISTDSEFKKASTHPKVVAIPFDSIMLGVSRTIQPVGMKERYVADLGVPPREGGAKLFRYNNELREAVIALESDDYKGYCFFTGQQPSDEAQRAFYQAVKKARLDNQKNTTRTC